MFFLPFGSVRRFKGEVAAIRRHNNGVPARREPAPHSGVWFAQRPFKGERVESRSRFVKGAFPVRAPEKPKQRLIYRQARYGSGFKGCLHKVVTISKARGSESCLFLEVFSRPGSQGPGNFICSTVVMTLEGQSALLEATPADSALQDHGPRSTERGLASAPASPPAPIFSKSQQTHPSSLFICPRPAPVSPVDWHPPSPWDRKLHGLHAPVPPMPAPGVPQCQEDSPEVGLEITRCLVPTTTVTAGICPWPLPGLSSPSQRTDFRAAGLRALRVQTHQETRAPAPWMENESREGLGPGGLVEAVWSSGEGERGSPSSLSSVLPTPGQAGCTQGPDRMPCPRAQSPCVSWKPHLIQPRRPGPSPSWLEHPDLHRWAPSLGRVSRQAGGAGNAARVTVKERGLLWDRGHWPALEHWLC